MSCCSCPSKAPTQFRIPVPDQQTTECQIFEGPLRTFVSTVEQTVCCTDLCGRTEQTRQVGTVQVVETSIVCNDSLYSDIKLLIHLTSSLLVIQVAFWPTPCGTQCNGFVVGGTGTTACACGSKVKLVSQIDPVSGQETWIVSIWI